MNVTQVCSHETSGSVMKRRREKRQTLTKTRERVWLRVRVNQTSAFVNESNMMISHQHPGHIFPKTNEPPFSKIKFFCIRRDSRARLNLKLLLLL